MSERNKPDISSLDLDVLMQGLDDRTPALLNSVESWLLSAGYYPGSTKRTAAELYPKYLEWLELNPEAGKRFDIRSWGKVMTSRFKRSRSNTQSFYYISTESLVELSRKLSEGGVE